MSATVERAPRGQFDGVLQIVRYNWTLYIVAVLVSALVVLLVEHLRDGWNLAAFGPGAFHFFPRHEWLRVAGATGFQLGEEFSRTVFVRAFVFLRA